MVKILVAKASNCFSVALLFITFAIRDIICILPLVYPLVLSILSIDAFVGIYPLPRLYVNTTSK